MAKKTKKEVAVASTPTHKSKTLAKLQAMFPSLLKLEISYQGSGDSFESFDDYTAYDKDGINLDLSSKLEELFGETEYEDVLDRILDASEADFNNDGSRGTITFDLVEDKIIIDNYYYELQSFPSGEVEFEDEPADGTEEDTHGKKVEDI